jgi:predicted DNA-binding transcriptional regulator YafY
MRADRLVALVLLLRRRGRLSASELADELEVSTRTVLRDIDALSIAGVPVYAERGRHGGFELLPGFRTELTGLNHQESLALLAAGSRRGVEVFGLGSSLASAMLKVFDALPNDVRDTATAAAERLLIDPEIDVLARRVMPEEVSESILHVVRHAVLNGRRLRIRYAAMNRSAKWRTVDPVGLVAVHGRIYLLATRSGMKRTYRLSRMAAAEELAERVQRSETIDLEREWQQRSEELRAEGNPVTAILRVDSEEIETVVRAALHIVAKEETTAGRWELTATFRDEDHAEWVLWQLGTNAEALSPQWLRTRLRDRAESLTAHYSRGT